jgi:phytoene synthase
MMFSPNILEESYSHCREINRRSHSNFIAAFKLLPPPQRRAMEAIYAFMRYADDAADEISPRCDDPDSAASVEKRRSQIEFCRWLLVDVYRKALNDSSFHNSIADPKDLSLAGVGMKISPALIDTVERFRIPYENFVAVLDGVEMDLTKNRYENFGELEIYCERVASAVGLACIHVWGFEGKQTPKQDEVFELARKVGIAYQLTNILRDVKEDAAMDRVYLPLDEISAAGYSVEELKHSVANPAFEKLMRGQIARAEDFYRAAGELYVRLHPEGRKIFGLMTAIYRKLLSKIAVQPVDVFARRIRLSPIEKIFIVGRWTILPPRKLDV